MKNSFAPLLSRFLSRLVSLLNPIPGWTGPTMHEGACRCAAEKNVSSFNVNPMRRWTQNEATKRFECVPRAGAFRKVAGGSFPWSHAIFFLTRAAARLDVEFLLLRVKQNIHAEECATLGDGTHGRLTLSLFFFMNHAAWAWLIYISSDSLISITSSNLRDVMIIYSYISHAALVWM